MKDYLRKFLSAELNNRGLQDVGREDGYYTVPLRDKEYQITICIEFSRIHDIDPEMLNVEGKGGIIIVPSFWIDIPKELAIPYLEGLVDTFYSTYGYDNSCTPMPDPPEPPPPPTRPLPPPPKPKPPVPPPGTYL